MFEWLFDPYSIPFWIFILSIIGVVIGLVYWSFLPHIKFAYPNAKFEAIGNPYIGDKELSNIVESKDLNTFKETLNASKDYTVDGENTYTVQNSLDENFLQTIEMMRKDSPEKLNDFYDMYLEKIDIYLIKNEIKKLLLKKTEEVEIERAILPSTKEFLTKFKDTEKENLQEVLRTYGFEKELIEAISEDPPDLLKIDMIIDKHIINKFKQVKVPNKCEQAKQGYISRMIDILNIKNILRGKQLGYDAVTCKKLFLGEGREIAPWKFNEMVEIDQVSQVISSLEGTSYFNVLKDAMDQYDKDGSVQVLENVLDGHLLKLVKDISMQNYLNLGPSLRFLVSKEFEIKNLKIIAKGVDEQISSDMIKGLLVTEAA